MNESLFQRDAVRTLARKSLSSYFETPSAYIALFVFYLLTSYVFCLPLFLVGQASIKRLMDFEPLFLAFLVPALTMGLLAEELRSGTFEFLATLPLEDRDIVLGKFLGFAQLHAITIAGLIVLPLALALLVQPPAGLDWGETLGVLGALLLQGFLFGAVGLFSSSLSGSQAVSFVVAFLICFAFFAAGKLGAFFPGLAGAIVEFAGIDGHTQALAKGVLDTRDLVYFGTVTAGFLCTTVERLRARRA